MTSSIDRLPPPYPNQALAWSKETSQIAPQKVVQEAAAAHPKTGVDQSSGGAKSASDTGQQSSGAGTQDQSGNQKYNVVV